MRLIPRSDIKPLDPGVILPKPVGLMTHESPGRLTDPGDGCLEGDLSAQVRGELAVANGPQGRKLRRIASAQELPHLFDQAVQDHSIQARIESGVQLLSREAQAHTDGVEGHRLVPPQTISGLTRGLADLDRSDDPADIASIDSLRRRWIEHLEPGMERSGSVLRGELGQL